MKHLIQKLEDRLNQSCLPASMSVSEAVRVMAQYNLEAIAVMEDDKIAGYVSEHEIAAKLIAINRDPKDVVLIEIAEPDFLLFTEYDSTAEALKKLEARRMHYALLRWRGQNVAVVRDSDLLRARYERLCYENAEMRNYIAGGYTGAA